MKTAIVLGATGLVGKAVVSQLIQEDGISKIIAVTRREHDFNNRKVHNLVVNFEQLAEYADQFKADMLFSCLGTTVKQAGSIAAQRNVDLDYQYEIADIAAQNQIAHYLLVSSSGANSQSKNAYLQMKGELEEKVKQLPFKCISIVQPSLLKGERNHFRLAESLGNLILPLVCLIPGLRQYRPISGQQVAKKLVSLSKTHVTGSNVYRLDALFKL